MPPIQLDPDLASRLERLARRTGRAAADHLREAILTHLEDEEDARLATQRLDDPGRIWSAEEVKRGLGLSGQ